MKKILVICTAVLLLGACSSLNNGKKDKFTVEYNSPKIPITQIEAQFETFLGAGKLKKSGINVEYYPKEDAVCLNYTESLSTYNLYWNRENRDAFLKALDGYKKDYSERNLGKNSRKAKKRYGNTQGYLIWQIQAFGEKYFAPCEAEFGYYFKDGSPYFSVKQNKAEHIKEFNEGNIFTSNEVPLYFTRAQADKLAELLDPYYLRGLLTTDTKIIIDETSVGKDEY